MATHRHSAPIGVLPVPHGPETGEDYPTEHTTEYERQIFGHVTRPDDSYTPDGVYWADLPWWKRVNFVSKVDRDEALKELRATAAMMKKDPLSPVSWYFRNAVLPGAGLGLEGYVLFSIGNLEPLFAAVWPECWGKSHAVCTQNWVAAVTYLEIVGIMIGQAAIGVIGDWIGRRYGLIQDAAIMFIGLLLLTGSWAASLQGWVIFYAWSLFFYGFGVGGEYPITATSSMENAVAAGRMSTRDDRLHRGRKVTMAFLMQGWGQLVNQVVLIVLLVIFNRGYGDGPYSVAAAQYTFRISFALPAIGTLWLVYYRIWKMPRANQQLALAKKKQGVTGYDINALKYCCQHFGGRLLATAGTWFCNDVFFYGNKLFQGQFISIISSNPDSLLTKWTWSLINVVVSLCGYYLASMLIDNKLYGRKMMQQVGFLMCFIMFVIPAFNFDYYVSPAGVHAFQAMYFLSSFFNQFGPNSVTFLVAGEVFPTPIRATAHGFSACIGKAGALLASVLYNYIDTQTKFYVVPWFGLAGMLLTWLFLPDTTGLDLKEQERRWTYIRNGKEAEYHGVAVHPTHLSVWERLRGVGKYYDAEKDHKAQIEDMRKEWEERQAMQGEKEPEVWEDPDMFSEAMHGYFKDQYKGNNSNGVMTDAAEASSSSSAREKETGDQIQPSPVIEARTDMDEKRA
ncbi:major facilitator superfamily domain-containing protein [Colletotrichum navitas]|uniref:Major facilitator superfamily domain-containing protein n=1 Tax=Colletotrichum navitas TaxID=681940 RepID=A0AAD8Q8X0_9PEZI|nr:major facilitator superfamily domain-containing protein [Colletotrichum navitas]KAK1597955.1 major facilitator superfamily domain-containing protein [Colletotrichum navitas]